MRLLWITCAAFLAMPLASFGQQAFRCDFGLPSDRYSQMLASSFAAMIRYSGESCLRTDADAPSAYRFLWIRSMSDEQYSVRLELNSEGGGVVTVHKLSKGGKKVREIRRDVSASQVSQFTTLLDSAGFWGETYPVDMGFDGADWVLEAFDGQRYRMQYKWSPKADDAFRRACWQLFSLSKIKLGSLDRIY